MFSILVLKYDITCRIFKQISIMRKIPKIPCLAKRILTHHMSQNWRFLLPLQISHSNFLPFLSFCSVFIYLYRLFGKISLPFSKNCSIIGGFLFSNHSCSSLPLCSETMNKILVNSTSMIKKNSSSLHTHFIPTS